MTTETNDRVTERKEYHQHILDKLKMETSSAETFEPKGDKETYVELLENKIDSLKLMINEIADHSKDLEENLKSEFDQDREILEQRYQTAKSKLNEIRKAGGDAWLELHTGTLNAWNELAEGIKSAVSKFK